MTRPWDPAAIDEQDIIDLLELQCLSRELLDHLTAMFPLHLLFTTATNSLCLEGWWGGVAYQA